MRLIGNQPKGLNRSLNSRLGMNSSQKIQGFNVLRKHTLKERVILELSEKWPQTQKELFRKLCMASAKCTYQAIHKSVHELVEDGVLAQDTFNFRLSSIFVKENAEFWAKTAETYEP